MDIATEIKSLKMDVVEELLEINSPEILKKIKSYISKVRKQTLPNDITHQALEEMKNGEMIHFTSFDDFVKATKDA